MPIDANRSAGDTGASIDVENVIPYETNPYTRRMAKERMRAKMLSDATAMIGFMSLRRTSKRQMTEERTWKKMRFTEVSAKKAPGHSILQIKSTMEICIKSKKHTYQSSYLNSPDGQKIKNDEHIITNGPKNLLVTWEKRRNMIHNKCKVVSNGLWRIL